jgi:hypothetical protein
MLRLVKTVAGVLTLVFTMVSMVTYAKPTTGSCQGFEFPMGSDPDAIDTSVLVRVLRHEVPVYSEANGSSTSTRLDFDTDLKPIRQTSNRVLVQKQDSSKNLGWIEKHDLLCQVEHPLLEKGLPRKAFAKIATDTDSFQAPVYSSPDRNQCPPCEPLSRISRFSTNFVFAEDPQNRRYLLAGGFILSGGYKRFPLVGWIDEERMIPWNTNLGIRPKNDTRDPRQAKKISGYYSLKDSQRQNKKRGVELLAGNVWYTFPLHMPLLDTVDGHYHVAAPGVGMKGFKTFNPNLEAMKRVDVFFVVDGTASMDPYIEQVKWVVEEIVYHLSKKTEFKETTFRFGFLVYRDDFGDKLPKDPWCRDQYCEKLCVGGLCERKRLENSECDADNSLVENSGENFLMEIGNVRATRDDKDDYPERLFDGLKAVIPEIANCGDNTKLVFVIGDHGDRQEQMPQYVINRLVRNFDKIGVFFIQTPKDLRKAKRSYAYRAAYQKFERQARDVIEKVYSKYQHPDHNPAQYFLSLTQNDLAKRVIDAIKPFSSSVVVSELEQILLNGESVKEAIRKYRKNEEFPVLYWQWMEDSICEKMGEQCENTVNHQVGEFYLPIQAGQMQEEVVLIERHIDRWINLLNPLVRLSSGMTATDKREKFVELLHEEIQKILGDPPIEIKDPRTLAEILQSSKLALPANPESPLLQYTFEELQQLEGCEMERLRDRLRMSRALLTKVIANPTLGVSYTLEEYQNSGCPLSDKGKNIKRMRFGTRRKLGDDDSYRYGHALKGITLYWLPMEFLP